MIFPRVRAIVRTLSEYLTTAAADLLYEPKNANIQSHISDTTNPHAVTAVQVGADLAGTAVAAIVAHEGASDPHPQYLTPAEADAAYAAIGSAAAVSNVISVPTTIAAGTSYIVASYLKVDSDLTINGNLMVIG